MKRRLSREKDDIIVYPSNDTESPKMGFSPVVLEATLLSRHNQKQPSCIIEIMFSGMEIKEEAGKFEMRVYCRMKSGGNGIAGIYLEVFEKIMQRMLISDRMYPDPDDLWPYTRSRWSNFRFRPTPNAEIESANRLCNLQPDCPSSQTVGFQYPIQLLRGKYLKFYVSTWCCDDPGGYQFVAESPEGVFVREE
ncbi:MAG: hypothetical protein IPL46_19545 [Saprospiraceae bacterium]|nr:hypothetical protein [Saprospiraceae bacterium]